MTAILIALVEILLNWALSRTNKEIKKILTNDKRETEGKKTDAKNLEKYVNAKDRVEKIRAAQDLLNSVKP